MSDPYIELLKMAKEDLLQNRTITYTEFENRFKKIGLKQKPIWIWRQIYGEQQANDGTNIQMGYDSYMALLEYEEFQHAINESKNAKKQSRIAIWVAIILGGLQLILGFIQINQSCY